MPWPACRGGPPISTRTPAATGMRCRRQWPAWPGTAPSGSWRRAATTSPHSLPACSPGRGKTGAFSPASIPRPADPPTCPTPPRRAWCCQRRNASPRHRHHRTTTQGHRRPARRPRPGPGPTVRPCRRPFLGQQRRPGRHHRPQDRPRCDPSGQPGRHRRRRRPRRLGRPGRRDHRALRRGPGPRPTRRRRLEGAGRQAEVSACPPENDGPIPTTTRPRCQPPARTAWWAPRSRRHTGAGDPGRVPGRHLPPPPDVDGVRLPDHRGERRPQQPGQAISTEAQPLGSPAGSPPPRRPRAGLEVPSARGGPDTKLWNRHR